MVIDVLTSPEGQVFHTVDEPETRNKFVTGKVTDDSGEVFFLKAARDPDNPSVREDLGNEVRWNEVVGPQVNEDYWQVPEVIAHDPDYKWAIFEYVDGKSPTEEQLEDWLPVVTGIAMAINKVPLGRPGSDLSGWYQRRLGGFGSVTKSTYFDEPDRRAIATLTDKSEVLSKLRAGMIHGDLKPNNLILS